MHVKLTLYIFKGFPYFNLIFKVVQVPLIICGEFNTNAQILKVT